MDIHAGLEQMGIEQVYEFKTNDLLNRAAKNATTSSDVDLCCQERNKFRC